MPALKKYPGTLPGYFLMFAVENACIASSPVVQRVYFPLSLTSIFSTLEMFRFCGLLILRCTPRDDPQVEVLSFP